MPVLNFKKQFAANVESGAKRQTIRARRADGRDPKTGDILHLYTGMRTKYCRKLGQVVCESSVPILIDQHDIVLAGNNLDYSASLELAQADGFADVTAFKEFFLSDGKEQFEGRVIRW